MKKTKVIYALIASAMLSMAVIGCGSNETIENDINVESTTPTSTGSVDLDGVTDPDDTTPTTGPTETTATVPAEATTPEPTETTSTAPEPTTSLNKGATLTVTVKHVDYFSQKEIAERDTYSFNTVNVSSNSLEKAIENYTCIGMESTDQYNYIRGYYDVIWDVSVKNGNRVDREVYNVKFDVIALPEEDLEIVRVLEYMDSSLFTADEPTTTEPTTEPTEPETPVVEVPKSDWYTDNNIIINGEGTYKCQVTMPMLMGNDYITSGNIDVSMWVSKRNDNTTKYTLEISTREVFPPYIYAVDKYTGIEFTELSLDAWEPITLSNPNITLADGTVVEFIVEWSVGTSDNGDGTGTDHRTLWVTVPSEYDGLLFKVNSDTPLYFSK